MKTVNLTDEYTITERVHMYGYVLLPMWRQEEINDVCRRIDRFCSET